MINELYDYLEAGFRVFGIHGADGGGYCACGDPDCTAVYKHPIIKSWQNVPAWSDDQIEAFDNMGHFDTGYGVLCSGWLIVDVDARNGGVDSFKQLCADIPAAGKAAFVVNTGSGGGSQHHYFRLPEKLPLMQKLDKYPGIDFKTSGYVIGAGSMHVSGATYEAEKGYPQDIKEAPAELLKALERPSYYRVSTESGDVDVDANTVGSLLDYITPDCSYDQWIKTGMAIHHSLRGDGFDLWDRWSASGEKYPGTNQLQRHWHSFGKSANPAGYGTLLHYAKEGGYCEPVTFVYEGSHEEEEEEPDLDTAAIDLKRPPGFVGELTEWINSQCLYPRESLAVGAALCAVSSLAGMRVIDELDGMSANLIVFGVAGSGTGKEAVQQAYLKILRAASVHKAVYGNFKSEQELMRNLLRHQGAFYAIDELGLVLRKLENASKKGGASYLEGIIGLVMSIYSKANGYLPITGDLKQEMRNKLTHEIDSAEKQMDKLPADSSSDPARVRIAARVEQIKKSLGDIENGLDSPYLTILGFTTPVTFDELMGFEQATNGFLARAMILKELENNPRRKKKFKKQPMTPALENQLRNLYAPGCFDMLDKNSRVEHTGEKVIIPTTENGMALLDRVYDSFHAMAEEHKGATGLEAIPRRGYELTAKISLILGMPGGVRTAEHIRWAFAFARQDAETKIRMAYSTEHKDESSGLAARVESIVSVEHGETLGVICNRLRGTPREQVKSLLQQMVDRGMLRVIQSKHPRNKSLIERYFLAQNS